MIGIRAAVVRGGVALLLGNAVVTGCDYSGYPIEASFCDEWCRTLRRTACDQEPENCVRDCESALPSARCFELQVSLLECYRETPPDGLVCVDRGFQGQIRPRREICMAQRDELIGCEAPRVKSCIDACRALDARDPVVADGALDADVCPESPMPCERLCWELDARAESGIFEGFSGEESDGELAAVGTPLVTCAKEAARQCQAELAVNPDVSSAEPTSWTRLFLECAGLPTFSLQ